MWRKDENHTLFPRGSRFPTRNAILVGRGWLPNTDQELFEGGGGMDGPVQGNLL